MLEHIHPTLSCDNQVSPDIARCTLRGKISSRTEINLNLNSSSRAMTVNLSTLPLNLSFSKWDNVYTHIVLNSAPDTKSSVNYNNYYDAKACSLLWHSASLKWNAPLCVAFFPVVKQEFLSKVIKRHLSFMWAGSIYFRFAFSLAMDLLSSSHVLAWLGQSWEYLISFESAPDVTLCMVLLNIHNLLN